MRAPPAARTPLIEFSFAFPGRVGYNKTTPRRVREGERFTRKTDTKRAWQIVNIATIAIALAILVGLALTSNGPKALLERMHTLHTRWLLGGVLCMGGFWVFESLLLHSITRSLYPGVPLSSSLHTVMIGQLYSALTPFSTGGQPVQLLSMVNDGMDTGGAGFALTIKSITWQVGLTLSAVLGALYGLPFFMGRVAGFAAMLAFGLAVNAVVILSIAAFACSGRVTTRVTSGIIRLLSRVHLLSNPEKAREKALKQFDIFHASIRLILKRKRVLAACVLLTALQFICYHLVAFMVYRAFGGAPGQAPLVLSAAAIVALVSSFVPLPGGSGGAEGAFYLFFALFFAQQDVIPALLLWRLITYYSAIAIGVVALLFERRGRPRAPRLARCADGCEGESRAETSPPDNLDNA